MDVSRIDPSRAKRVPTPTELAEILVDTLAAGAGGDAVRWREVLGAVRKLALTTGARSNWSVEPRGSDDEMVAVQRAVKIIRAEHPYVSE